MCITLKHIQYEEELPASKKGSLALKYMKY